MRSAKATQALPSWPLAMVSGVMTWMVRQDGRDLTNRQVSIILAIYLDNEPQTVRGLAQMLGVNKPAVTRATQRLIELGLAKRLEDPRDGRSIIIGRTSVGRRYVQMLRHAAYRSLHAYQTS